MLTVISRTSRIHVLTVPVSAGLGKAYRSNLMITCLERLAMAWDFTTKTDKVPNKQMERETVLQYVQTERVHRGFAFCLRSFNACIYPQREAARLKFRTPNRTAPPLSDFRQLVGCNLSNKATGRLQ
jgi:hypothetical protein